MTFWVGLGRFGLGRVNFGSGQLQVNRFLVQDVCHAKISNFLENFGSGMVWFGSIRVSGLFSDEPISDVGPGMGPGRLVRISDLKSVLSSQSRIILVDFIQPNI